MLGVIMSKQMWATLEMTREEQQRQYEIACHLSLTPFQNDPSHGSSHYLTQDNKATGKGKCKYFGDFDDNIRRRD